MNKKKPIIDGDINKAQTEYLVMLSKALSCKVEDLLEYNDLE